MRPPWRRGRASDPQYARKVPSVMAVMHHPIHPMVVVFPIAFLMAVPATDLAWLFTADGFWARLSLWLTGGGLVMGLVAAVFGIGDLLLLPEVRRKPAAWGHFIAAVMVLALAGVGLWLRMPEPAAAVWPWGLAHGLVTAGVLAVAGWLGGTLSFHHGVGVYGHRPHGSDDAASPGGAEENAGPSSIGRE